MRRIATLLATGAVAAIAAITVAASPAIAATNTFGGTASTTAGGSGLSAAATTHGWKTHYTTPAGVSGKGSYSFTKTKHLKLSGTVTDKRTGKYYACVRFKAVDAHGNGVILTIKDSRHGATGTFDPYITNFRAYHLFIAK